MGSFDLRLIEEHAEDLYEHAPCGYLSTATDGTILKMNETLLNWLGYERSELVGGKRFQELLSMGGRIYYETHFAPLLNMQGFVNEVAFDLVGSDRRHIPVLISTVQRRDSSGAAMVNRITVFNVTDRRTYERELLIQRQKAERVAQENAALATELQADIAARQHAEALLREQARLSGFAAQIGQLLIERSDVGQMLNGCTELMVQHLGSVHAAIWSLRDRDQTLELQASSGLYADVHQLHARVPLDRLGIGRIVADRRPHWTNCLEGDPLLPEVDWPRRQDIRAFAGYPLAIDDRVIGLVAMFFGHDLSDMVLETTSAVARHIALGIERIQAGVALKESETRYRALAEQLEQTVGTRTAALVESQRHLRALAAELHLAEQRERKRLAVELHDHLQQILVLGKIKLGQGKRSNPSSPGLTVMQQVDDLLTEALSYTRTLVTELSPPVLHDHGLSAALKWLGEYMKKHDLQVTVIVPEQDTLRLQEDRVVLLFQSVRELLINSAKHAGTGEATVALEHQQDQALRIEVRDNGKGFDASTAERPSELSSKFGLFSIQERMRALGGSLDIESSPLGTRCVLTLPLP